MKNGAAVTERLAAYALGARFEDIPAAAVARQKEVLVHDLVMGLLGAESEETAHALALIRGEMGAAGNCTVIGQAKRASAADAVFANAVMIRTLRQEQTLFPSGIHGGAVMIPVALALGELHARSGAEVLTALIAGQDIAAKLDRAAPEKRNLRTASHPYSGFGVAAVAARLLGLDQEQTAIALAYAGNLAVMIQAGFEDHQYGLIARNGLMCAYLGQARAPAPRDAIEGTPGFYESQQRGPPSNLEGALATLGSEYEVMGSELKPLPGGVSAALAVSLLRGLVAEHGLSADQIESITIHRRPESNDEPKHAVGPFASHLHAVSSVPFGLASVLVDGDVSARRLKDCNDPKVLDVARRVHFVDAPEFPPLSQRLELRTRSGAVLLAEGGKDRLPPVDLSAIIKFHGSTTVGDDDVTRIRAAVDALATAPDPSALTTALRPR